MRAVSCWPAVHEGHQGIGTLGDVLGVALAQDDVGGGEDGAVVGRADAHHFADDLEGEAGRHLDDEVAPAQPGHPVDDRAGHQLDVLLDALDHAGVEGGRDDAAQAGVAGVVGADHGAEVLEHLLGHVRRCWWRPARTGRSRGAG